MDIYTLGHSNHSAEHLLSSLEAHQIRAIADVRRFPGSRKHPQFQQSALSSVLHEHNIDYHHFPGLGGRRSARIPNSPNTAWRVNAFNAYADHMQSAEFQDALRELETLAATQPTAILCSEALPWRCHRRLIADALIARGWTVFDIFDARTIKPHPPTPFAQISGTTVTYPG